MDPSVKCMLVVHNKVPGALLKPIGLRTLTACSGMSSAKGVRRSEWHPSNMLHSEDATHLTHRSLRTLCR
jgi:hypothetical protein